jgi:hypothetical protein
MQFAIRVYSTFARPWNPRSLSTFFVASAAEVGCSAVWLWAWRASHMNKHEASRPTATSSDTSSMRKVRYVAVSCARTMRHRRLCQQILELMEKGGLSMLKRVSVRDRDSLAQVGFPDLRTCETYRWSARKPHHVAREVLPSAAEQSTCVPPTRFTFAQYP